VKKEIVKEPKDRMAFLEEIFESTPTGVIILEDDGKVIMMNRKNEQVARLIRREVVGKYYHDIPIRRSV
jgi:PAS domain S-box-containing protein